MKPTLIFLNTHPIQYFAPLYQMIEKENFFDMEVWYGTKHGLEGEIDKQFGKAVKWDIPLLEGYKYSFLKNYSWKPSIYNGFWGVINLAILKKLYHLPQKSIIVIHGWYPFSSFFTIICAKILGHITCLRAESPLSHESRRSKSSLFLRNFAFKYGLFKLIDKFLYIGEQNKRFYQHYGVKEERLVFTPYSVNNTFFRDKAAELQPHKNLIKTELGLHLSHKVILFSGKLIAKKNPFDLLKAFHQLPSHLEVALVFVGDGELRLDLENYIKKYNIQNVFITGFINQSYISKYYAVADVFVMCSGVGETWGLSTNEAMNFSLPVLISDKVGCCDDLVKNSENGFVFPVNDIVKLSINLQNLLTMSSTEIKEMGELSLKIITKYSYESITKSLNQITLS